MISEIGSSQGDEDFEDDVPQMSLVERYEKFPEYLEVSILHNPGFFDFIAPLNAANRYSIQNILNKKNKELISMTAFPLKIRIFLVPHLNVLTTDLNSDHFTTDQILGNLLSFNDEGS